MKRAILLAGLAVLVQLAPPPAGAAPSAAEVEASRRAVAEADPQRLYDDQDYARGLLGHLDVLDLASDDPELRQELDVLRLDALSTLGRDDEVRAVADRLLARRPSAPGPYEAAWWSLLSIPDVPRAVAVIDQASRRVPGVGWAALRASIGAQVPSSMLGDLRRQGDDATRQRLAEALFRIGWPGGANLEQANWLRSILLDYRLAERDLSGATALADGLADPVIVVPLLVMRRYDAMTGSDSDREARLRRAIADYDRLTQEALGAAPGLGPTFDRARFLRLLGRDREALAMLEPFTRDIAATVEADYRGMWMINEAAEALDRLGRKDEAVALMERLVALPVAEHGGLIGPSINHAISLVGAGRHAAALAFATRLESESGQFATGFGRLWIDAAIVCALAGLDRRGEIAPVLERLRAGIDVNAAALLRAQLCLGDLDAAEAVVIHRLEGDQAETMVLAFQDYQVAPAGAAGPDPVHDRLMSLRERPAVRAALDRVGRVLPLPLARIN